MDGQLEKECGVQWLWPGRVALGKLTLLAGDPGVGKSMVALDIAARLSRGAEFTEVMPVPNLAMERAEKQAAEDARIAAEAAALAGSRMDPFADVRRARVLESGNNKDERRETKDETSAPMESAGFGNGARGKCARVKGMTLIYSAEDDWDDTVVPRLKRAGADMAMIQRLVAMDRDWGAWQAFSMRKHLSIFEAWIGKYPELRLFILDPITACMDGIDHHSTSAVRVHLAPLVQMAAVHGVAVLGITHLNKRRKALDMYRTTGSMAVAAIARAVHFAMPGAEGGPNVLTTLKNNLGVKAVAQAYRVEEGKVVWLGGVESGPGIVDSDQEEEAFLKHDREMARDFLVESLADKPRLGWRLIARGRRIGISMRTMMRAKAELGVRSKKNGKKGWYWVMGNNSNL